MGQLVSEPKVGQAVLLHLFDPHRHKGMLNYNGTSKGDKNQLDEFPLATPEQLKLLNNCKRSF